MYLFMPGVFFVPAYYAEKNIINIKKVSILQNCKFYSGFENKIAKRKEIVIGVSLPNEREDIWIRTKEEMEKYAKKDGVTLKVEFNDFDVAKQVSQVENLILQGLDVLIIAPFDQSAAADIVEKAHKEGIKVIALGRPIENSDLDLYISFNNLRVGELQGRYITQKVPRGNYIILSGEQGDVFKDGAMEYIQPLVNVRNIKIVTDKVIKGWDPQIAFKIVEEALIANKNKVDAILAPNDTIAGAAIEALKTQGLAGKVAVTGQDADLAAIRRITQGTQLMTVLKDVREEGKTAMEAAIKLANGEAIEINGTVNNGKIDVPSIFITPIAIDQSNIDSTIINSGYLKKEDIYNR